MCNDKPNFFNFILTVLRLKVSQGSDLGGKKKESGRFAGFKHGWNTDR